MILCGFEKFSMVDFDGKIACTVFTGGCNFRCPFCHNGALVIGNIAAQRIDESEVFEYLEKRKTLVDAVCVTGGEPTLQPDLADFYRKVKAMGFCTKLDTNGLRPDVLRSLLDEGLLDNVAMDIKNSKEKYAMTVGLKELDMSKIEESIEILKHSDIEYEFRTTLIEEFHDEADMLKIAEMIHGAKKYFMQKYKDNDGCIAHGYTPVDREKALSYKSLLERHVESVGLRGYN